MQVVPDLPAAIDPDLGARNYFWVFIHSAAGKGGAIHGDVSLRWCKSQLLARSANKDHSLEIIYDTMKINQLLDKQPHLSNDGW